MNEPLPANSEDLYQALINTSPDGIVITDLEARIIFASPAALKMMGLETLAQARGMPVIDWFEDEDKPRIIQHIADILIGIWAEDNLYHLHNRQGVHFVGEINAALLHDSCGQVSGIVANLRDVTDRWRTQEALEHSEMKFRSVVEASPVGMHFYRLEAGQRLVLEDANPAADHILKFQHGGLIGKTIEEAFPGLAATEIPTIYRRLAECGGQWRTDQVEYDYGEIKGAYEVIAFQTSPGHMVSSFTDITERKIAEAALRKSLEDLKLLARIDRVIIEHDEVKTSLQALTTPIADYFHADAVEIMRYDAESQTFSQVAGRGFVSDWCYVPCPANEGTPGLALQTGKLLAIPDLNALPDLRKLPFQAEENFVSGYSIPLNTPARTLGVLQLFYRSRQDFDAASVEFLEAIAGQVAITLEKTTLWEKHQKTLGELVTAYESTLEGWVYALDLRDHETEDHTQRVTSLTVKIARAMGVPPVEIADMRRGALLHDIGKVGIPDSILHKTGPLTPEEWTIMRRHPEYAANMLSSIHYLRKAADIPYCHHERWDGSGYPRGLKGTEIPLAARIFAVADVWDALTSDRPYREAWPKENVVDYLTTNAGKLFDADAVRAFLQVIQTNIRPM